MKVSISNWIQLSISLVTREIKSKKNTASDQQNFYNHENPEITEAYQRRNSFTHDTLILTHSSL